MKKGSDIHSHTHVTLLILYRITSVVVIQGLYCLLSWEFIFSMLSWELYLTHSCKVYIFCIAMVHCCRRFYYLYCCGVNNIFCCCGCYIFCVIAGVYIFCIVIVGGYIICIIVGFIFSLLSLELHLLLQVLYLMHCCGSFFSALLWGGGLDSSV